jgi:hypothetical protein
MIILKSIVWKVSEKEGAVKTQTLRLFLYSYCHRLLSHNSLLVRKRVVQGKRNSSEDLSEPDTFAIPVFFSLKLAAIDR